LHNKETFGDVSTEKNASCLADYYCYYRNLHFFHHYETLDAPGTLENVSTNVLWKLDIDNEGVILTDSKVSSVAPIGGDKNGIKVGNYRWLLVNNGDDTVSFKGQGNDTVTLACNKGENNKLRAYKNTTISGNQTAYPSSFTLYRLREEVVGGYSKIQGDALVSGTYVMVLSNGYVPTVYTNNGDLNNWVLSENLNINPSNTPFLNPDLVGPEFIWTIEI